MAYAWAPDSRRLAFVALDPQTTDQEAARRRRDDARPFEDQFRRAHLWTIDVEGKALTRLTEGEGLSVQGIPSWAPDSRRPGLRRAADADAARLAQRRLRHQYLSPGSRAGSAPVRGPTTRPRRPGRSAIAFRGQVRDGDEPAGQRKALAPKDGTPPSFVGHAHLLLYDVAADTLTDAARDDFDIDPDAPHWTPDSTRLVFTGGARAYNEVFAYDVADKRYRQLTKGPHNRARHRQPATGARSPSCPTRRASPAQVPRHRRDVRDATARLTTTNPQVAGLSTWARPRWSPGRAPTARGSRASCSSPWATPPGQPLPAAGGRARRSIRRAPEQLPRRRARRRAVWAGKGWAVFYPNPRGSTNYGEQFRAANINDWGGGDYQDIMTVSTRSSRGASPIPTSSPTSAGATAAT